MLSRNYRRYQDLRERTLIFDPAKAGKLFFPVLLEAMALFSAIYRAKASIEGTSPLPQAISSWWLWAKRRDRLRDDLREGVLSTIKRYLSEDQVRRLKAAKRRFSKPWFS